MLRSLSIAAIAAIVATPVLAKDCNWGAKASAYGTSAAATQSLPAYTSATVQPVAASSTTYGTSVASQPVYSDTMSHETVYQASDAQPLLQTVGMKPDIVDTAVSAGSFGTLVAAVQAAGLVDTLKGPGPFTVFAPTDEAFAALPAGTVENLLKPENIGQLQAILKYHVVPGNVTSDQLAGQILSVGTVQGQSVTVDGISGVKVGTANVVTADIATSNGVIHVIDSVLLPSS